MRPVRWTLFILVMILVTGVIQAQNRPALQPCPLYTAEGEVLGIDGGVPVFPLADAGCENWPVMDEISMVQIGALAAPQYNTLAGGDSDLDSYFEVYMYIKDNAGGWSWTYRIYEDDGQNVYHEVFQTADNFVPYAFGDQDGDGLPEVIGHSGSYIHVYESPAVGELATSLAWVSPAGSNVLGYTAVGDLDQDGLGEIYHSDNTLAPSSGLVIYECTGDNQYQQIYSQPISIYCSGQKVVADFDQDGHMELVFPSAEGIVHVFESTGDNTFVETWQGQMNTDNAYACSYADDMDGNGFPEFICGGSSSNHGWRTIVFEATGNDSYITRQVIDIQDGYFGLPGNTAGDFDGDGTDEFMIQTAGLVHIYKWNGFEYASEGSVAENPGNQQHCVYCYDANGNGYDDVFWAGIGDGGYWENDTVLLEYEDAGSAPDISVSVTPYDPPIIIPGYGGSFEFNISALNNESTMQVVELWCDIMLPNGQFYGPVIGPVTVELPSGILVERDRTQEIPGRAMSGIYTYHAYLGIYPDLIWDHDSFTFEKTGEAGDTEELIWNTTGESFAAEGQIKPREFRTIRACPNPFNPTTTLNYQVQAAGPVRLTLYDIAGRQIAELVDGWRDIGSHEVTFDGASLVSGVYLAVLKTGNAQQTEKLLLVK